MMPGAALLLLLLPHAKCLAACCGSGILELNAIKA
jgi:hypothetical protein